MAHRLQTNIMPGSPSSPFPSLTLAMPRISYDNSGPNSPSHPELAHLPDRFFAIAGGSAPCSPVSIDSQTFFPTGTPLSRHDSGVGSAGRSGATPLLRDLSVNETPSNTMLPPRTTSRNKRPSTQRSLSTGCIDEEAQGHSPAKRGSFCDDFSDCQSPVRFTNFNFSAPRATASRSRSTATSLFPPPSPVPTRALSSDNIYAAATAPLATPLSWNQSRSASQPSLDTSSTCYRPHVCPEVREDEELVTISVPAPRRLKRAVSLPTPMLGLPLAPETDRVVAERKLPVVREKGLQLLPPRLKELLDGEHRQHFDDVIIIDCRYPYEYEGGHIKGSVNLWTPKMVIDYLIGRIQTSADLDKAKRTCVVLHCEFTSERAPKAMRHYREFEHQLFEKLHKDPPHNYAECFHELYLLRGGYKRFFQSFPEECHTGTYLRMDDVAHRADFTHYQKVVANANVREHWITPSEHAAFVRDTIMAAAC
eukprot:m.88401 g.88401  ORF g.88401 m.88401 type:complete len:479 (+) comp14829_c0_seq1:284-1720(+)